MLREAFFTICKTVIIARSQYVSLYCRTPFYGGPEEGGWWDEDINLIAYDECSTGAEAEAIKGAVEKLAAEMSEQAKEEYGEHCLRQLEWCESHGVDPDFLGEVDGEEEFFVVVEETPGSLVSRGCRQYQ